MTTMSEDRPPHDIERDSVIIATDVSGTTYSDTGLSPATEYSYRARSVRA